MIIDLHEKCDVSPEWLEDQLKAALDVAEPSIVEKLTLPRLCTMLSVYKVKNEAGAQDAARRMKVLVDSPLIDEAME